VGILEESANSFFGGKTKHHQQKPEQIEQTSTTVNAVDDTHFTTCNEKLIQSNLGTERNRSTPCRFSFSPFYMMSSSKQPPTSEKLMVSLVDAKLPIRQGQTLSLSKLSCGSQESSLFLKVPRSMTIHPLQEATDSSQIICEMQSISTDFGSFLLTPTNTLIGKDSNLYVTTPVDPLFFLLQHSPSSEQWQPWDQIMESMSPIIRSILPSDKNQLMHLYARMAITEDEVYYKFSIKKSLDWLEQKFTVTQEILNQQQKKDQNSYAESSFNNGRSSVASNFCLGKQATATSNKMTDEALKEEQQRLEATREERLKERCRIDAAQIICDYLNEEWRQRFLAHVNLEASVLEPKKALVTAAPGKPLAPSTDIPMPPPTKKSKPAVKVSSGIKKLGKVNIKGMQKMSFFFAKKENKAKT
jgi:hypothetical protein